MQRRDLKDCSYFRLADLRVPLDLLPARLLVAFFLRERGQPCRMSRYALVLTVDLDLGRLLPARLRRLILFTNEFLRLLAMRAPVSGIDSANEPARLQVRLSVQIARINVDQWVV